VKLYIAVDVVEIVVAMPLRRPQNCCGPQFKTIFFKLRFKTLLAIDMVFPIVLFIGWNGIDSFFHLDFENEHFLNRR
jgi:hypothetical protein